MDQSVYNKDMVLVHTILDYRKCEICDFLASVPMLKEIDDRYVIYTSFTCSDLSRLDSAYTKNTFKKYLFSFINAIMKLCILQIETREDPFLKMLLNRNKEVCKK